MSDGIGNRAESWRIDVYLAVPSAISLIAVSTVTDPQGVDLNVRDSAAWYGVKLLRF